MKMGSSYVSSCLLAFVLSSFLILLQLTCSLPTSQDLPSAHPLCNHDQSNALLHFKKTIQYGTLSDCDTAGANLDSWKERSDCCSWDGVRCNEVSGDVVELDLSCSGIDGSILSNSTLFNLPHLQSLNLAYSIFPVFQISSNFGKELKYLNLSSCFLSGFVPLEIANFSKLETLEISSTAYKSNFDIPIQQLTKLRILILDGVNLNWNKLEEILNLTNMIHLELSFCGLEGELASLSFSDLETLEHLNMDGNKFSGGFPISLANLPKLSYLSLTYNNITGHIPSITTGFQAISTMKLDLNSFGGRIPAWLFNRSSLQVLDISHNLLVGPLPFNNGTLYHNQLMHIDLSDNGLTGTIPSTLFASPSLVSFLLRNNNLTGYVGEFRSLILQRINLNSNSLKGGNFSSISKLVNLKWLDLSSNKLAGTFELDLFSRLENLEFVALSENILLSPNSRNDTAYLPLPKLRSLLMENCNANGIPFFIRNLVGMDTLSLSRNNIHGLLPEWLRSTSITSLMLSDNSITSGLQNLPLDCEVDLSFNKLRSLPSNFSASFLDLSHNFLESGVENLPYIQAYEVNLSFNNLKGELKGNISITILDLSHNALTGAENIQGFGLTGLNLSFNNLQGTLPIPSGDKMIKKYVVSNNQLSGNIHPDMCEVGPLQILNLSYNNLSGNIPECFLKIPSLYAVNLKSNNFSGIIPQTITKSLGVLDMSSNQLQGIIPRLLANCQDLMLLDLSNNLIYDMFPTWLEDNQRLEVLVLGSNRLNGDLSSEKLKGMNVSTAFSQLKVIDVSNNKLFGVLPSHYFESWRSMMNYESNGGILINYDRESRYVNYNPVTIVYKGMEMKFTNQLIKVIDFSNNNFEGVIPESIGNLSFLMALNLSSNQFRGEIPSSLGKLVELNSLDLSNNNLSGRIPGTLPSLTFLGAFNVSDNNLEGPIPQGGQFTTFSNDSFKGNLNLCGFQLATKCDEQLVPHSPPVFEPLEENDKSLVDGFSWESVAIGYGCGFILGIFGGVLILKRYQEFFLGIFNIRVLWRIKRTPQR